MLVVGFPAVAFGTNCYVVAPGAGEECVVIDPGIGVVDELDGVLREHRLQPVAVLLTHGHLDHTFSVTPVCGARGIPAFIHPADEEQLADPMAWLSPETETMFGGRLTWTEPDDVRLLDDGAPLELAGLRLVVDHAPGHTAGSVMFRTEGGAVAADGDDVDVCWSGDVLFAGSIGRTDLPGGSYDAMMTSLATKVLPLPDDLVVLPGHGPQTTVGRERLTNPFLAEAGALPAAGPTRGL